MNAQTATADFRFDSHSRFMPSRGLGQASPGHHLALWPPIDETKGRGFQYDSLTWDPNEKAVMAFMQSLFLYGVQRTGSGTAMGICHQLVVYCSLYGLLSAKHGDSSVNSILYMNYMYICHRVAGRNRQPLPGAIQGWLSDASSAGCGPGRGHEPLPFSPFGHRHACTGRRESRALRARAKE